MTNKFPDLDRYIAELDADHLNKVQAAINVAIEAEELAGLPKGSLGLWRYGVIIGTLDYMPATGKYIVPIIRIIRADKAGLTSEEVQQGFVGYLNPGKDDMPLILVKSPKHG